MRDFKTHEDFYISKKDFEELKNKKLYRLMDALNFIKTSDGFVFDSLDYQKFKGEGEKIMHWLPIDKDSVKTEILMPDHKIITGLGESGLKKLKENEIIQAERFGFIRLDEKTKATLKFWFTHN